MFIPFAKCRSLHFFPIEIYKYIQLFLVLMLIAKANPIAIVWRIFHLAQVVGFFFMENLHNWCSRILEKPSETLIIRKTIDRKRTHSKEKGIKGRAKAFECRENMI